MNVLITGITGFVASHLAEYILTKENVTLYGTKRWRSPMENISNLKNKINFIDMELHDALSVKSAIQESEPDIIFHLAAQSFIPAGTKQPESTMGTNAMGTLRLLEAVRSLRPDTKIHVASTADVYGNVDKEGIFLDETALPRPPNLYSISKLAAEYIAIQYHDTYDLKTVVTRMLTHTGPRRGQAFVESDFAKQIVEIELGMRKPEIHVGNLGSVRTFLDVRDAVRAYWDLIHKCEFGEVYNICGNTTISIRQMLDIMISLSKFKDKIEVKIDEKRFRPNDSFRPGVKIDKFLSCTNWQPKIDFKKTLSDLLDYWREKIKDGK
jgi:GDP-mannose 4,6-dehydratase